MHSIFSHYYAHKRDYLKSSPPQQHKGRQNTSAATLVLLKLDEILPLYCAQLAASNFDQCCKILDTHASAPFGPVRAEAPCEPYCGTPPSGKSPIRTWLAGASGDSTQHNHLPFVSILKSNLDIFFTLAGAESLYSSLSHSLSAKFAQIVVSSYGEVIAALQHARESLCDAILSDNREASPYLEKARNLATTLNFIIFFSQARSRSIQMQSSLWDNQKPNFSEFGAFFASLYKEIPDCASHSQLLCQSLKQELHAWENMCRTAFSLQHCRFGDAVLTAQKAKIAIFDRNKTYLDIWMGETLKSLLLLFPIVFDRALSCSLPLYGFEGDLDVSGEEEVYKESPDSVNSQIVTFLNEHRRTANISIALIADAVRSQAFSTEEGFAVFDRPMPDVSRRGGNESARLMFPPLYMRTLYTDADKQTTTFDMTRSIRRHKYGGNSFQKAAARPDIPKVSDNFPLENALQSHQMMSLQNSKALDVLDGGINDATFASWPHTDWEFIVGRLPGPNEVSWNSPDPPFRNHVDLHAYPEMRSPIRMFHGAQSCVCLGNVSDSMWLVGMVKKSSTRRHELSAVNQVDIVENNLNQLIAALVLRLRVVSHFSRPSVQELHGKCLVPTSHIGYALAAALRDGEIGETEIGHKLRSITIPTSRKVGILMRIGFLPHNEIGREGILENYSGIDDSASAYFLGADLTHVLNFE